MFDTRETESQKLIIFGIMGNKVSDFFKTYSPPNAIGESAKLARKLVKIHGGQDKAVRFWESVRDGFLQQF